MCYRIIASGRCGGQQGYELPLLLFSLRPRSAYCALRFSFSLPLHLEACSQAIKTIANSFMYYREMDMYNTSLMVR